jgi:hypothetical protein
VQLVINSKAKIGFFGRSKAPLIAELGLGKMIPMPRWRKVGTPPGVGVSVWVGSAEQIIVLCQPQEEVSDFVGVPGGWGSSLDEYCFGGGSFGISEAESIR